MRSSVCDKIILAFLFLENEVLSLHSLQGIRVIESHASASRITLEPRRETQRKYSLFQRPARQLRRRENTTDLIGKGNSNILSIFSIIPGFTGGVLRRI